MDADIIEIPPKLEAWMRREWCAINTKYFHNELPLNVAFVVSDIIPYPAYWDEQFKAACLSYRHWREEDIERRVSLALVRCGAESLSVAAARFHESREAAFREIVLRVSSYARFKRPETPLEFAMWPLHSVWPLAVNRFPVSKNENRFIGLQA